MDRYRIEFMIMSFWHENYCTHVIQNKSFAHQHFCFQVQRKGTAKEIKEYWFDTL